jgi:hypothetical protein
MPQTRNRRPGDSSGTAATKVGETSTISVALPADETCRRQVHRVDLRGISSRELHALVEQLNGRGVVEYA